MEALLKEISLHESLEQMLEHLGTPRFWRALVLALRQVASFDNALVVYIPPDAAPLALEESTFAGPLQSESPVPYYCRGMYLLDPFYIAIRAGISGGLYRLEDLAPDQFRQSEYYLNYFSREVGQDELQFLQPLENGGVLSFSIGTMQIFDAVTIGKLHVVACWVLSSMKRHWTLAQQVKQQVPQPSLHDRLDHTLQNFGAERLSKREAEIARLTLCGHSSKAVAQKLLISPETVKVHKRVLYSKLGITSHADLFNCFMTEIVTNNNNF